MKKIIYLKQSEKANNTIEKIILKIKSIFNVITLEESNTYCLPVLEKSNLSEYKIKRTTKKIIKLLDKNGSNTIVLSKYLNQNEMFKNYLYSHNINILDGRFLFKCLIYKIIEYICKIKNKPMNLRRNYFINQ